MKCVNSRQGHSGRRPGTESRFRTRERVVRADRPGRPRPRAFTLIEVLVVVTILIVIASLAIPLAQDDHYVRLHAASSVMISDLEFAQVMSISHPRDPIIVRFEPAENRYWLAFKDDPDEPIRRANSDEPYVVTLGQGRAASAAGAHLHLFDVQNETIEYNAYGGLRDDTAFPEIELSMSATPESGRRIRISIDPITGRITETAIKP